MIYHEATKTLLNKIPTMRSKPLSYNKKHHKLLTDIVGHWYMEK